MPKLPSPFLKRLRPKSRSLTTDPLLAAFASWRQPARRLFGGRHVVVTGGAGGIGRAIALGFALEGARVTVLDFNSRGGRETQALLRRLSPASRFRHIDLRDTAAVARVASLFTGERGVDVLVNNAAMAGKIAPFHELKWNDCAGLLRANLEAPFLLSQCAAKAMIKAGRKGSIINILTIQTGLPVPGYSAYIAGKGGLDALTLAMAADLAPFGIRVNGVRVGSVLTENYLSVLPEALKQEVASGAGLKALDRRAATLLGRMGLPVEIARVVVFLASEQAGYLTGSIIRADGGRAISRKVEPLL